MQGFSDILFGAFDFCLLVPEFSLDFFLKVCLHWLHDGYLNFELGLIVHDFGCKAHLIFRRRVCDYVNLSEATLAYNIFKLVPFLEKFELGSQWSLRPLANAAIYSNLILTVHFL